jgi:hypothetical protein
MIADVEKMVRKDFAGAYKVNLDRPGERPRPLMRFLSEAARLMSPIL